MSDVVNLSRFRKRKARARKERKAEENRVKFGRTKAEKKASAADSGRRQKALDGKKLELLDKNNIAVRMAGPTDARGVAELRWRLKNNDEPPKDADLTSLVKAIAGESGDLVHWVAESEGDILAVMSVRLVRKVPKPGKPSAQWGYLTNVYTVPERRNDRLGARLLAAVKDWAKKKKGLEFLIVWPGERARSFYEKAGFTAPNDVLIFDLE